MSTSKSQVLSFRMPAHCGSRHPRLAAEDRSHDVRPVERGIYKVQGIGLRVPGNGAWGSGLRVLIFGLAMECEHQDP